MRKLGLMLLVLCLTGSAWATTFTPELIGKLETSPNAELIRILITMEEQADFNWMVDMTAHLSKLEKRQFVLHHLNQIAEVTQTDVKAYLEAGQASGKVKNLQSVAIVNLLHCLATPEVIRGLMSYPEIAEVAYDPERYMLGNEPNSRPAPPSYPDEVAWGVADVHAPEVWQQGFRGAGILVSVIDTGVNYNHLDLMDHMWNGGASYPHHGWDFYNNDNDPIDQGPLGHGTHCAGSVASDGTAGSQCGVAPDATIMAVQVLSGAGYGSEGQIISGINFAVQQGVDIFSMSLGHPGGGTVSQKQQYRTACNNALAAGVIGSIAAGNENGQYAVPDAVRVPGSCPPPWLHPDQTLTGGLSCVVTIGATQSDHTIAGFSSHGPVTWSNVSPWNDYAYNPGMGLIDPDISAPGVSIKSCDWDVNNGYAFMDGTSMATPHVAGGMALLLSKDPSLTPALIDMYLETYATALGTAGKDNIFGSGLMNCLNSINAIQLGPGPYVIVSDKVLDDIGGNNNGAPDPGETCSMIVTLYNVGQGQATNVVGTLSTTDPYLTITQNTANYPNLAHLQQGQGAPAYLFNVSPTCPQGQTVSCLLHITADSAYTNDATITFLVGNPMYDPTGPDAYGYSAYDINDGSSAPVYNWLEIAPAAGGPGTALTALTGQDDLSTLVTLPFTFQYYGQDYTQITVCTNGWVAMGDQTTEVDWSNTAIPNTDGPAGMIAPFWEDMNMETGGQIATYFNAALDYFVIEFYRIPQWTPATAIETFEVVLYDPALYPTSTGDGKILMQYNQVSDPTSCTAGIEDPTETIGLQYLLDGGYDIHATPLAVEMAILYTTPATQPQPLDVTLTPVSPPIQIPATGGSFNYSASVANNGASPATFDTWIMVQLPSSSWYGPVLGPFNLTVPAGATLTRLRTQNVPGSAPAGIYTYRGYLGTYSSVKLDSSSFNFTKLTTGDGAAIGQWENFGQSFEPFLTESNPSVVPEAYSLEQNYPNPFNPTTAIRYQIPDARYVSLRVYDTAGRLVATLVEGWQETGAYQASFDASNLASGIYLYRLEAGDFTATKKLILLK